MYGWMDGLMDVCMYACMYVCMHVWVGFRTIAWCDSLGLGSRIWIRIRARIRVGVRSWTGQDGTGREGRDGTERDFLPHEDAPLSTAALSAEEQQRSLNHLNNITHKQHIRT